MNKNVKIFVWVVAILVVLLLILTVITPREPREEVLPPEEEVEVPTEEEPIIRDIGAMADNTYVEIMARNIYEQEKDLEGWINTDGWGQLLDEYGVSQDNFDNFVDQLLEDPVKFQDLQERWYERYLELAETTIEE